MAANAKPIILAENRLLDGTPTATDTATGYDVLNLIDLRPFTFWQAGSHGTKYITVDCGAAAKADCIAMIGHNLYTADADVSVEVSADNFAAETIEGLAAFTPTSDRAFLKTFTERNKQYWRIKIVTAATAAKIGVLLLGSRLDFPRYPAANFDPSPERLNGIAARSKAGHMIGATLKNISHEIRVEFRSLTPTWFDNTFKPVWDAHLSQLKPFFFSWDNENHPADVRFLTMPEKGMLSAPYDPFRRSMNLTFEGIKET